MADERIGWVGGQDWTGTTGIEMMGQNSDLHGCGLTLCREDYPLEEELAQLRTRFGFPTDYEFHGYELRKISRGPDVMAWFLRTACTDFRCIVLLFDKQEFDLDTRSAISQRPHTLAPATGIMTMEFALSLAGVRLVEYDGGDIQKKEHRNRYRTRIRHLPGRSKEIPLDVRPRPSEKSALVQFADVITYLIKREAEDRSETAEIRQAVRELRRQKDGLIDWGNKNDLQSYLS